MEINGFAKPRFSFGTGVYAISSLCTVCSHLTVACMLLFTLQHCPIHRTLKPALKSGFRVSDKNDTCRVFVSPKPGLTNPVFWLFFLNLGFESGKMAGNLGFG